MPHGAKCSRPYARVMLYDNQENRQWTARLALETTGRN